MIVAKLKSMFAPRYFYTCNGNFSQLEPVWQCVFFFLAGQTDVPLCGVFVAKLLNCKRKPVTSLKARRNKVN